jgi:type VI secretion system protein ImpK
MAEEQKKGFDPDATVSQPEKAFDAEATFTGGAAKFDPESTDRMPAFDPDATVNPAERATLDPDATVRIPSPGKQRRNPFAPAANPESLQANLSNLGGINPLVAMANPILGAVPQIRRTLRHPDPARLKASLHEQIESFQTSAMSADVPDLVSLDATYALCALLDESAAATPWGAGWIEDGLLKAFCDATDGATGFFERLARLSANASPEDEYRADLLEFFYVCMALGFEGRHRGAEDGRKALKQEGDKLYALIARRRPRPLEGLSEHWRTPVAQAAVDEALATAAKVTAARAAAEAAAHAPAVKVEPAPPPFLKRLPRRAVWSAVAGLVGASIVLYMLALRLLESDEKAGLAGRPGKTRITATQPAAGTPAPMTLVPAAAQLSKALEGEAVSFRQVAEGTLIRLNHGRQFASGSVQPAPELEPLLAKIGKALSAVPGAIVVTGHSDAVPRAQAGGNQELSAARARAVADRLASKVGDPKRVRAEGKADQAPLATGDAPEQRARNRRVEILLRSGT